LKNLGILRFKDLKLRGLGFSGFFLMKVGMNLVMMKVKLQEQN